MAGGSAYDPNAGTYDSRRRDMGKHSMKSIVIAGLCILSLVQLMAEERTATEPSCPSRGFLSCDGNGSKWFNEYRGDIDGNLAVGMTIVFEGDRLWGKYFYARYLKEIRISGQIAGRSVTIEEFDSNDRKTGVFQGRFVEKDPRGGFTSGGELCGEVIVGKWCRPDGTGVKDFYLRSEFAYSAAPGENRYSSAGFHDDREVDAFAGEFQKAVAAGQKEKVVSMISFPISVNLGGKRKKIPSPEKFVEVYDLVFSESFKKMIADDIPFHMFAKYSGVMLGDGEIWFAPITLRSKKGEPETTKTLVVAVNNDNWLLEMRKPTCK